MPASLKLEKSSAWVDGNGDSLPNVGEQVEYKFTLTNTGDEAISGIVVSDTLATVTHQLEGGGTFNRSLAPGQQVVLLGSYSLEQAAIDTGEVRSRASASGVAGSTPVSTVSDEDVEPLARTFGLDVNTIPGAINDLDGNGHDAGDQVVYSYSVANNGNTRLFNVVLMDDNGTFINFADDVVIPLVGLTDEDGDGQADDLAVGGRATGRYTNTFSQAAVDAGQLRNIAMVSADNTAGELEEQLTSARVRIEREPLISLVKTTTNANITTPGEAINYDYAVTNTGNISLLNVTLSDDNGTPSDSSDDVAVALSGLTDLDGDGNSDDLAVGSTAVGNYIGTATQAFLDTGGVTNQAITTGRGTNNQTVTDDDSVTVPTLGQPAIAVTKTIAPGTTVTHAGDSVPYRYTLTNTGNLSLLNVTLIDDNGTPNDASDDVTVLPLFGLTDQDNDGLLDDLAVGNTATGTYIGTISQAAIDAGALTNIVVGTGTSPQDETVTDDATATITPIQNPAIDVTKAIAPGTTVAQAGDPVPYRYTLTNTGNVSLLNVQLLDDNGTPGDTSDDILITPLTGLTDLDNDGKADDLAVGATTTGTYIGTISQAAIDAGELTNIVVGTGTSPQGQTLQDDATATISADAAPAIDVTKTIAEVIDSNSNGANDAGDRVVYDYSLTNTGNVSLLNVQLLDDNGTPEDSSDDVTITPLTDLSDLDNDGEADDLAVGATATGRYTGTITEAAVDAGELTNIVVGTGTSPQGQTVEDQDTQTVDTVLPNPGIALQKLTSSDGVTFASPSNVTEALEVEAGAAVYWRYEVTNTGNVAFAATDLSIRDDNGTPLDLSDDFNAVLDITSDLNGNGSLDTGETWIYNASALAQDLSFSIDFDSEQAFSAGDAATTINAAYANLEISTANIPGVDDTTNRVMIFDTANPTGGDVDLGTPGQPTGPGFGSDSGAGTGNTQAQGNVLIISEDGDSSDPDDNATGGTLNLAWTDGPIRLTSLGLLDIDVNEEQVTAETALAGTQLTGYNAQNLGDNSFQTLTLGGEWADQLAVNFVHSGAITGFTGIGAYGNEATVSVNFNGTTLEASATSYYTNSYDPNGDGINSINSNNSNNTNSDGINSDSSTAETPDETTGTLADIAVAIPQLPDSIGAIAPVAPNVPTDVLFVVGGTGNRQDEMLQQQLRDRGFNLTILTDDIVTPDDGNDQDLVLISESVLSSNIGSSFTESTTTVMTWEAYLYDDLGMTGLQANVDFGWSPGNELASNGATPSVYAGDGHLSWAIPGSEATTLATLADGSDRAAIFGYETGALLSNGIAAPGKRVGFFAHSNAAALSEEGLALFHAAVDYAVM